MKLISTLIAVAIVCAACGTSAATADSPTTPLFDALPPTVEGSNSTGEILRSGNLVLIDDDSIPIPSGTDDYERFVVNVDALRFRNGEVGFHLWIGNMTPDLLNSQCDQRRGLLLPQPGGLFTFTENGNPDTDLAFDSSSVECGEAPPPHPAGEMFRFIRTIGITSVGDDLLFEAEDGSIRRFSVEPIARPAQ